MEESRSFAKLFQVCLPQIETTSDGYCSWSNDCINLKPYWSMLRVRDWVENDFLALVSNPGST